MHIACFFYFFYCYNYFGDFMYYFKKEDDCLVKYNVKLDIEQLKKIRWEVIDKCSLIIHKCYKTTHRPNEYDYEHIRNYKEKKVGVIEYNDFYSMPEDEYLVEYDYYQHPHLISLIDSLLEGKINVIDEIIKLQDSNIQSEILKEELDLLNEQNEIIGNLNRSTINNRDKQIEMLNSSQKKINDFKKKKELNKNQVSEIIYCSKILECIHFLFIDKIELYKIEEVNNFYKNSMEKNKIKQKS